MPDTDQTEAPPGMGDNNPPTSELLAIEESELLARIEPLCERANKLPKKIETDADVELVAPVVVDAKALHRDLEAAREKHKGPITKKGREIDGFFREHKDRIQRVADVFTELTSDFQRRKVEAERARAAEEARKAEAAAAKLREEAAEAKKPETAERREAAAQAAETDAARAAAQGARKTSELARVDTGAAKVSGRSFWNFSVADYSAVNLDDLRDFLDQDAIDKAIRAKVRIQKGNTRIGGVKVFEDVKSTFR